MAAPVARRAVASTIRRAAAQAVPRASTPLFAAAARCQHRRPAPAATPLRQTAPALGARWYSAGQNIPDSRTWSYDEMKQLVAKPDSNTIIVGTSSRLCMEE